MSSLLFTLSSVAINIASEAGLEEDLNTGIEWAARLLDPATTPPMLVPQGAYNLANGLSSRYSLHEGVNEAFVGIANPDYRLRNMRELASVRGLFASVGHDLRMPADLRGRALCNLGNVLDESGRWVEAYSAYADALTVDPTNGNAAGNLAELLRRRLAHGADQSGHLAAVYDRYVDIGQALRERTVELAGAAVADRSGRLKKTGGGGHFSHVGDDSNPYHRWIVEHRLALVATVEGLGSDSSRWDTASITRTVIVDDAKRVPPIFAAMNVLKAEFLVARRLASLQLRKRLHTSGAAFLFRNIPPGQHCFF